MFFGIETIYLVGAGILSFPPTIYVFWKSRSSCEVEKEGLPEINPEEAHITYNPQSGTMYRS